MKRIGILLVVTFITVGTFASQGGGKKTTKNKAVAVAQKVDSTAMILEQAKQGNASAQNIVGSWYYAGKDTIKQDYKEAYKWWALAAKQDHALAIGNMALCCQLGHGTKKDSVLAVNLYEQSIKKGNDKLIPQHEKNVEKTGSVFSCLLLHECYQKGIGVKKDQTKAATYLEKAAEKGHLDSQYSTALYYYNTKQYEKAAKWFKEAAKQKHIGATYNYGFMTYNGQGVKQNREEGLKLLKIAANKDFTMANYQLGRIYLEGDGIEKDAKTAVPYLQKAAFQNNINAKWLLSQCYLKGEGVSQSYYFGTQWLADSYIAHKKELNELLAADNNGTYSTYLSGLRKYYVEKDYTAAAADFSKVEKAKIVDGTTMLGVCYANKENAKCNEKKAVKLLQKASENSPAAAYYLSSMYETGTGVAQDGAKALELLKKAADAGVAYAQCKLGDQYFTGNGVSKDLTKAALLYLDAEAQNHLTPASAKNLAKCYEQEVKILPDLVDASKRIEALGKQKVNGNLVSMLKKLEEK